MNTAQPVTESERIAAIDVIRGVALLGIFIMNVPIFSMSPFAGADGSHFFNAWYDRIAESGRDLLFAGKFNSMFSFLFAVGFTVQYARLRESAPQGAKWIYLRRLLVLALFGFLHGWLIWWGDVLHIYAVLGIFLILVFYRLSDRWIWVLIGVFATLGTIINLIRLPTLTPQFLQAQLHVANAFEASTNLAFGRSSFAAALRENFRVQNYFYFNRDAIFGTLSFWWLMFTTMLLGLLAGRHRLIQRASELIPQLRRGLWWALGLGIGFGALFTIGREMHDPLRVQPMDFVSGVSFRLCRVAMMIFYMSAILLLLQRSTWSARFKPIGVVGRMPLSNYLLQTAIALTTFYGWGLGFWNKVGPALGMVYAVAVYFLIQVPLSNWWLNRHRYGPMEWLWRALTYGRRPA